MAFWQRLVITLIAMFAASLAVGLIWDYVTGWQLPSYLAGIVGGLTALPVWELLKRVGRKHGDARAGPV
jgi:hypothetical protein